MAANGGAESRGAFEVPLLTDASFTGMAIEGYGPYRFFNTIPTARPDGIARAAIVLRAESHLRWDAEIETTRQHTDDSSYHGRGWLVEELAALASLALGTRLQSWKRHAGVSTD